MSRDTEMRFTKTHEWVLLEDGVLIVGITDHAQQELGSIVYVDLPEIGDTFEAEEECAVVESVKTAADVYAPLDGEIAKINTILSQEPALLNKDPFGSGWLFKMKISKNANLKHLMSLEQYDEFVEQE